MKNRHTWATAQTVSLGADGPPAEFGDSPEFIFGIFKDAIGHCLLCPTDYYRAVKNCTSLI